MKLGQSDEASKSQESQPPSNLEVAHRTSSFGTALKIKNDKCPIAARDQDIRNQPCFQVLLKSGQRWSLFTCVGVPQHHEVEDYVDRPINSTYALHWQGEYLKNWTENQQWDSCKVIRNHCNSDHLPRHPILGQVFLRWPGGRSVESVHFVTPGSFFLLWSGAAL